jgi:hypothetical protein
MDGPQRTSRSKLGESGSVESASAVAFSDVLSRRLVARGRPSLRGDVSVHIPLLSSTDASSNGCVAAAAAWLRWERS